MKSFPKIIFLATCIFFSACMATVISAQEQASDVDSAEDLPEVRHVVENDLRELTREEKLENLNEVLKDSEDELVNQIPGTAIVETPEGSHVEFNGVRIENLSDEDLDSFSEQVNQKDAQINLENMLSIQRQLKQIQDLQQQNRQQEMLRNLNRTKSPAVSSPPRPPKPPPQPPKRY